MTFNGWFQFLVYFVVLLVCMRPLGIYMNGVFSGKYRFLGPLENLVYRVSGIHSEEEMTWGQYTAAMLIFSFVSLLLTYFIERLQLHLPWNPQHLPGVEQFLAWNTAASFTTNTNWQAYTGEAVMSYFTQMAALAYHNFFSAAVGIAVAIALVRGVARRESKTIGNFWVDTTRACLYVLLPSASSLRWFWLARALSRTCTPTPSRIPWSTRRRPSLRAPLLPRKRSRNWARTAVASSTPTAPIPSRIRPRSAISSRCR